ncbi:MAG: hypothetical protein ACI8VR_001547, partial [Candidatus Azotimanducaceae bacterium]
MARKKATYGRFFFVNCLRDVWGQDLKKL